MQELHTLMREKLAAGAGCKKLARQMGLSIDRFWEILDGDIILTDEECRGLLQRLRS